MDLLPLGADANRLATGIGNNRGGFNFHDSSTGRVGGLGTYTDAFE